MKKSKFMVLGLGFIALPVAMLPNFTSCSNKTSEIKVSNISLESISGHYTSEGTTYVLTGRISCFKAKVEPENATNKNVTWSIEKPEGSTAEATVDQNGNVKFITEGEINLIAIAKDGSNVLGSKKIFGVNKTDAQAISKYYFYNDDWSEICDYANQGYDALLDHYAGLKTLTNPFVGLERTVLINGQNHIVRVIDENHDTIAGTTNKAALTFELVTLLSNSNGKAFESRWDTTNNYDYTNSILRWNLNGGGSGSKPSYGVWEKSAFSMLPTELQTNIKTVTKYVATSNDYKVNPYDDKLFPLTYTEMAQTDSQYAKVEGTAYKYWLNHNTKAERIKKDVKMTAHNYWLASPNINNKGKAALDVNNVGETDISFVTIICFVSFGFCI